MRYLALVNRYLIKKKGRHIRLPFLLQAISKIHLTPNYGVASLFKMLTYSHVCSAFSSARALSLNVICIFEMACSQSNRLF
jgi:hypothetical protein